MEEKDLHEYNEWLTEIWSKQVNIPFMIDAPKAYLHYIKNHKADQGDLSCQEMLNRDWQAVLDRIDQGEAGEVCGECDGEGGTYYNGRNREWWECDDCNGTGKLKNQKDD